MDALELQDATTDDLGFLREVHVAAMRPHVERAWGAWDEDFQRQRFLDTTDPASHQIVSFAGERVGCQWVRVHPGELELVRLYLLPRAQNRGIGSELVRRLLERAAAQALPVRLRVLKQNPARRLYERLGFDVTAETETHLEMRARPRSEKTR